MAFAATAGASPCCCRHLPRQTSSFPSVTSSTRSSTNNSSHRSAKPGSASASFLPSPRPVRYGLSSSLILRFPPNFVRQLSTKARRNCSNIGVAQIVAASWSNPSKDSTFPASAAVDGASAAVTEVEAAAAGSVDGAAPAPVTEVEAAATASVDGAPAGAPVTEVEAAAAACSSGAVNVVQDSDDSADSLPEGDSPADELFRFDGSLAVHAGERLGRGIVTDGITTPVVNTSAYWFKNSAELIDFKEGRHASYEYGRYGNPTTKALEDKLSALEKAESTLFMASGMYASVALIQALVPAGGHIITTTDCYRKTRIFIENELPKMGITATVIDPADIESLKRALEDHNVSLFFTETPTNPLFRCVDIELVSKLCHNKGTLVCIDSTFATPINQKALTLGADIVLHSATKFINGHNDVIAGCISGSEELIAKVRKLHFVIGGVLNPNASSMILRGMKTLQLRVQHQNASAMRMAQFLEAHPKILRVYYPGLPSHREHHIAKKQMKGFGGVVSFEVAGDLTATSKFIDSLRIPYNAPSFGGCESIIDQPAIMSYWDLCSADRAKYGINDNLVRFSIGIEDFEDLKADVAQALEKI